MVSSQCSIDLKKINVLNVIFIIEFITLSNETSLAIVHILKESETDIREVSRQLKDLAVKISEGVSYGRSCNQLKTLLELYKYSIEFV
ncbi:hypothetical protein BpHYR1_027027 [Brachionus plicatilis]|uniref:Uncharacterized protein n=1 Tax=Brachionus plicatilis TaxID=10195 RepID=A0A3M7QW21_BRAPC|nr:hypothetical protein BpHYR1_027027 [Brachionus plicatilis]